MNDQIFQPGDKVMRVLAPGTCGHPRRIAGFPVFPFGVIGCVEECFITHEGWHKICLCGDPEVYFGRQKGGRASAAFRKVDEIKLCIEAVKKADKPVEVQS